MREKPTKLASSMGDWNFLAPLPEIPRPSVPWHFYCLTIEVHNVLVMCITMQKRNANHASCIFAER